MPPLYQVDAFTDTPFSGNPAAVCLLAEERDAEWMQAVAAEMNLAETAFVRPLSDGYELRWFTPTTEVNLCGHATLAGAHILWESGRLAENAEARFHTRSGVLTCNRGDDGIAMVFPTDPTEPLPQDIPLADILGEPFVSARRGREDWLVELASEEAVLAFRPALARLAALPLRGLIVTAPGSGHHDFVSRFFAPGAGIDEDPVTGSAHCTLAGYWGERLGKTRMQAWQASPRGGRLGVELMGDRVRLTGQAVTVLQGELTL
jgi:PhzF family phenazine biosynthesis protein